MATVNFPLTVLDADVSRIVAALRRKYGMPAGTQAQVIEALRQTFCATLEDIVFDMETEAAREAVNKVARIDAT
ncbi:MAG TPA: hypothetical protein VK196_22340 [Magnetospirillum sp.]|nr:hypothetical protein [Magnetospirillum sp.]